MRIPFNDDDAFETIRAHADELAMVFVAAVAGSCGFKQDSALSWVALRDIESQVEGPILQSYCQTAIEYVTACAFIHAAPMQEDLFVGFPHSARQLDTAQQAAILRAAKAPRFRNPGVATARCPEIDTGFPPIVERVPVWTEWSRV